MNIQCKDCGLILEQTPGKRERIFCGSSCRSNFWQKEKRKSKSTVISTSNSGLNNQKSMPKNKLPEKGEPKEGSMAFFLKYNT